METETRSIWMLVSSDRYELPIYVADTPEELSKLCGATVSTIKTSVSKARHGRIRRCRYVKCEVEADEDDY